MNKEDWMLVAMAAALWVMAACAAFYDYEAYENQAPIPGGGKVIMVPDGGDGGRG